MCEAWRATRCSHLVAGCAWRPPGMGERADCVVDVGGEFGGVITTLAKTIKKKKGKRREREREGERGRERERGGEGGKEQSQREGRGWPVAGLAHWTSGGGCLVSAYGHRRGESAYKRYALSARAAGVYVARRGCSRQKARGRCIAISGPWLMRIEAVLLQVL